MGMHLVVWAARPCPKLSQVPPPPTSKGTSKARQNEALAQYFKDFKQSNIMQACFRKGLWGNELVNNCSEFENKKQAGRNRSYVFFQKCISESHKCAYNLNRMFKGNTLRYTIVRLTH